MLIAELILFLHTVSHFLIFLPCFLFDFVICFLQSHYERKSVVFFICILDYNRLPCDLARKPPSQHYLYLLRSKFLIMCLSSSFPLLLVAVLLLCLCSVRFFFCWIYDSHNVQVCFLQFASPPFLSRLSCISNLSTLYFFSQSHTHRYVNLPERKSNSQRRD